jgi:hypothetical protein
MSHAKEVVYVSDSGVILMASLSRILGAMPSLARRGSANLRCEGVSAAHEALNVWNFRALAGRMMMQCAIRHA